MSPGKLREAILDVDSSIFKDPERGTLYRIPRQLTPLAQKLYRSLGIRRDTKPRELLNMSAHYKLARFTDKVLRTEG
jgi:hypothetical protein